MLGAHKMPSPRFAGEGQVIYLKSGLNQGEVHLHPSHTDGKNTPNGQITFHLVVLV